MADGGYDVADYRDVDPLFGTSPTPSALIARRARARPAGHRRRRAQPHLRPARLVPGRARRRRRAARSAPATSSATGGARTATQPPNDWESVFGGPAWTRAAGRRSGTCTCSPPSSPTSTGRTPRSAPSSTTILRFWLDLGVDGFRIDVAHGMVKAEGLPDVGHPNQAEHARHRAVLPYFDQDGVHEIHREWRRLARLLRRRADRRRRGVGADRRAARRLRPPRRAAPGVQLPLPHAPVGRARRCGRSSTSRCARPGRSARPPPGCCPTTTCSGTSPGTATASGVCGAPARRRC